MIAIFNFKYQNYYKKSIKIKKIQILHKNEDFCL